MISGFAFETIHSASNLFSSISQYHSSVSSLAAVVIVEAGDYNYSVAIVDLNCVYEMFRFREL